MNNLTTSLSAACPVRHSFNGGDGFNNTTICRHSDGRFCHNRLVNLNHVEGDLSCDVQVQYIAVFT